MSLCTPIFKKSLEHLARGERMTTLQRFDGPYVRITPNVLWLDYDVIIFYIGVKRSKTSFEEV